MNAQENRLNRKRARNQLGGINRTVAAILALIWGSAGIAGLILAYAYHGWLIAVPAFLALWYAVLWGRVAARARLLRWREITRPWRAR